MADIVEALRTSALLGDLPRGVLEQLVVAGRPVHLATGEVLLEEGAPADAMFVVLSGLLEVTKRDGEAELFLDHVRPGDPVGELGLVDRRPRSATVRAVEPSELLRIDAANFEGLVQAPGVAMRLLAATTRRLEQREVVLRQHARMATLGSLTAGLLHEINNPAAALRRASEHLSFCVAEWQDAVATLDPTLLASVRALAVAPDEPPARPDPDVEDQLGMLLERAGVDRAWLLASRLAAARVDPEGLERLATAAGDQLAAAARLLAAEREIPALSATLRDASARISDVVDSVKAYAHHDQAAVQQVQVHEGLDQALRLLEHRLTPQVRVRRDYDPELPAIEGYPGELNSVWTNLLDNALDAVGERGEVVVRTRREADRVVVEVADDGVGIPEEIRDRLFDPFVTTKPVGAGTGLGLAVAHTIVTQHHGGQLAFTSRPGRTVFTVRLPCRLPHPGA